MKLSDTDLKQLDTAWALGLPPLRKDKLLVTLIEDLKEARERLAANSQNSSRPPRTDAPWTSVPATVAQVDASQTPPDAVADKPQPDAKAPPKDAQDVRTPAQDNPTTAPPAQDNPTTVPPAQDSPTTAPPAPANQKRKVGHQDGAPGHGRALTLPVSATHTHMASHCAVCQDALEAHSFRPLGGHYVLDVTISAHQGLAGISVTHEKHIYGATPCAGCGHLNHSEPGSCPDDSSWKNLPMNERGLVGPMLASLIVCMAKRMRLSRHLTQEFLFDWLGIYLSTSTINRCIHEAGRAVEPLEEELVKEIEAAALAHADETPWKEWGKLLWLWVIVTPTVCLFLIGDRSKELVTNLFGEQFSGWLMSDGYMVYRKFKNRLRCWAHVTRKARGLEEAFNAEAVTFGRDVNQWLDRLMKAIYEARESPPQTCLTITFAAELAAFKQLCEQHRDSTHDKTRALAREFLNDWDAFWIVLQYPFLPLTNNEAERALRHWVIARLISQGTRTEQGTRAFGLLASVIETCRKRKILPWPYLAKVIAERRKGNPAPSFASAALAA